MDPHTDHRNIKFAGTSAALHEQHEKNEEELVICDMKINPPGEKKKIKRKKK